MKTFSVAVVAAVLLALICLQESSALPLSEVEDVEVPVMDDNGAAVYEEMPVDSWQMPYTNRHKRSPKHCRQEKSEELTRVTCTRVKARNQLEQFSPPEMKTFSVAVVAAVLLALICLQESSALPLSEVEDGGVPVMDDNGAAVYEEMPVDSWQMPYTNIYKRRPQRCRFCCNCCPGIQGCGVCCRF
ncbi:Hepcidin Precursor [Takifugu flavidus]|uniref:Hepcidin n=1 Tax=Takifugu flavidus TaxID=433684 RepID=A0A5C6PJI5_9TELE|nr:Hepcidin Precursor [Takifugu flavidus]